MVIISLERGPTGLRGELTRWMLELRAGVFVGRLSAGVRERLWKKICGEIGEDAGCLVYQVDSEQGYVIRFCGQTGRCVEDREGLLLVRVPE